MVGVAVEQRAPNVSGVIHLEVLPTADSESLHGMVLEKIAKGSSLLTDAWAGYRGLDAKGFTHLPETSPGGAAACVQWPLVHRAASNFNKWLLGTHRRFCTSHLDAYAAEFCWRTNRRNMSREDYRTNARELTLPHRLITLAAGARPRTQAAVYARAA